MTFAQGRDPLRSILDLGHVFTHAQVVELTGVNSIDLQNWANRKLIEPEVSAPGRQGKRRYSFSDVVALFVTEELRQLGQPAALAIQVASTAVENVLAMRARDISAENAVGSIAVRHYFTLVRKDSSDTAFRFTTFNDHSIPLDILFSGPAFIINTGELIVRVAATLEPLLGNE